MATICPPHCRIFVCFICQTGVSGSDFDENHLWIVKSPHDDNFGKLPKIVVPLDDGGTHDPQVLKEGEPIKCGDVIRLEHLGTEKNLHCHNHSSAISETNYEVSWVERTDVA